MNSKTILLFIGVAMAVVMGCEKVEEVRDATVRKTKELGSAAAQMTAEFSNAAARKTGQFIGEGASHFFKGVGEGIDEACSEFKSELEKKFSD